MIKHKEKKYNDNAITKTRLHLFELHEMKFCPKVLRNLLTETLAFNWTLKHLVTNQCLSDIIAPILKEALLKTNSTHIIDLCSGSGGPNFYLIKTEELKHLILDITLTDLHPNIEIFKAIKEVSQNRIKYIAESVDASCCDLNGFRTMYAAMHHLKPEELVNILKDCILKKQGFASFEFQERSCPVILFFLAIPFFTLIFTIVMQPFRYSRFIFTYLIPILPFLLLFDGLLSCFRTYSEQEFMDLTLLADPNNEFEWLVKTSKMEITPMVVKSYIGIPKS